MYEQFFTIILSSLIPCTICLLVVYLFYKKIQLTIVEQLSTHTNQAFERHIQHLKSLQDTLRDTLGQHSKIIETKLQDISNHVDMRLDKGFEKTHATFTDIVKRLALIDNAQQKLTELSSNVVSLQNILNDKRSRGAFGEVQLKNLIENMLPKENFSLQYQLNNGTRCDCILFLPSPTGNIVIDSKFPLENFQKLTHINATEPERIKAKQLFKQDIKKHLDDIATKYIVPGQTAEGAVMFIPAEAVFSEIHSEYPDLVDLAHQRRVWLASPTTMMAILTTASSVLKDTATQKHVLCIREHITFLAKDFQRFTERMDKLARHIDMAQDDMQQVQTSAQKLTSRFSKIEQAKVPTMPEVC
jgi:DNA recombination protein RmuC